MAHIDFLLSLRFFRLLEVWTTLNRESWVLVPVAHAIHSEEFVWLSLFFRWTERVQLSFCVWRERQVLNFFFVFLRPKTFSCAFFKLFWRMSGFEKCFGLFFSSFSSFFDPKWMW